MTEQPPRCGALLPWLDGGPPSVCTRPLGHDVWHMSADDVAWAGASRVGPGCAGGMTWTAAAGPLMPLLPGVAA